MNEKRILDNIGWVDREKALEPFTICFRKGNHLDHVSRDVNQAMLMVLSMRT